MSARGVIIVSILASSTFGSVMEIAVEPDSSAGSPSYSSDGKLHFRTLDGGAWRLTGVGSMGFAGSEKVGQGKPGTAAKGELDQAAYPSPVTFDDTGKPRFD